MFLDSGEPIASVAFADGVGFGYFVSGSNPCHVHKVELGAGLQLPVRVGSLALPLYEYVARAAFADPASGNAWMGTESEPTSVFKLALNQKGLVKGTLMLLLEPGRIKSMHLYTHFGGGNFRTALYSLDPVNPLLWQSGEFLAAAGGVFHETTIAAGSPADLVIGPGIYWLAWQTDSLGYLPSYVPTVPGLGFCYPHAFGPFPGVMPPNRSWFTGEWWSQYVTYSRNITTVHRDDDFASGAIAPPGSQSGWSSFGFQNSVAFADHVTDLGGMYRAWVSADPNHWRSSGVIANPAEWLPYSAVGTASVVRAKYFVFGGPRGSALQNLVPNMRLRLQCRFAVNSMLEVFNHLNSDPESSRLEGICTRLGRVPARDVPRGPRPGGCALPGGERRHEGVLRAFEALSTDPQDNGLVGMAESVLATYPSWAIADAGEPSKVYAPRQRTRAT